MMNSAAREKFSDQVTRPDAAIDLVHAALWVAADANPEIDVETCLARVDALAARAGERCGAASRVEERVAALNKLLFDEEQFRGDPADYYNPLNSYLDRVLERRLGIPISLAIVWISVARRIGLPVHGIGLPGHFLARAEGDAPIFVDCFNRNVLDRDGCAALLRQAAGDGAELQPGMLEPLSNRQVLARALQNLKQIFIGRREFERALTHTEWILLLVPDEPHELRDQGLIYRELECWGAAHESLTRFVELVPNHPDARALRAVLGDLRQRAASIN
jgi:regulator of sirC expression with transglutaminase-like and TPR domain